MYPAASLWGRKIGNLIIDVYKLWLSFPGGQLWITITTSCLQCRTSQRKLLWEAFLILMTPMEQSPWLIKLTSQLFEHIQWFKFVYWMLLNLWLSLCNSEICHLNKLYLKSYINRQHMFDITTIFQFCIYFLLVSKTMWFLFLKTLSIIILDVTAV